MDKKRIAVYIYSKNSKKQLECLLRIISKYPNWELEVVYIDTSFACPEFQQLKEACREGKLDLVLTKTVKQFGKNLIQTMNAIQELHRLKPSVGVYFEKENLFTGGEGNLKTLMYIHNMFINNSEQKYAAANV